MDGRVLIQSPAIIEWLEDTHPTPALLPAHADDRAHVRALAALVGCDIHPINNRRILEYLRKTLGADEAAVNVWCATWITAAALLTCSMPARSRSDVASKYSQGKVSVVVSA